MSLPPRDYVRGDSIGAGGLGGPVRLGASAAQMLNDLRAALRRLARLSAAPPLSVSEGSGGRVLSAPSATDISAKLSGTSSPYAFTEQVATSGGGWANAVGGLTGNAYPSDTATGVNVTGKVVRLVNVGPNDWRFVYPRMAPPGCTTNHISGNVSTICATPITASSYGEGGANVGGATVTLSQGGTTLATTTTDTSGNYSFTGLSDGTYTVTLTVPSGYIAAVTSQTVTLHCSNATVNFKIQPNYVLLLLTATLCPAAGIAACAPTTHVPVTCTFVGSGGGAGTLTATITGETTITPFPFVYGVALQVPRVVGGYSATVTFSATGFTSQTLTIWVYDGFGTPGQGPTGSATVSLPSNCVEVVNSVSLVPTAPYAWVAPGAGPIATMPTSYTVTWNAGTGCLTAISGISATLPQDPGSVYCPTASGCAVDYSVTVGGHRWVVCCNGGPNCDGTYVLDVSLTVVASGTQYADTMSGTSASAPGGATSGHGTCTAAGSTFPATGTFTLTPNP